MTYVAKGVLRRASVYIGRSVYQQNVASCIPYLNAGAPTNGTSGTLAGTAIKGRC